MYPGDKSGPLKHAWILAHDAINEHTAKSREHAKNKHSSESVASKRNQDAEGPDGLHNVKAEPHFSLSCCHQPFLFFRSNHSTARPDIGSHHALRYPHRKKCARKRHTRSFNSLSVAQAVILIVCGHRNAWRMSAARTLERPLWIKNPRSLTSAADVRHGHRQMPAQAAIGPANHSWMGRFLFCVAVL